MEAPGKPIESNALKSDTMTHLEEELTMLKSEITVMWQMVISQLYKTREALLEFDKDLAREVVSTEKRVNSLELKIDRDCENIFALFNPVAVDLRTVLAILKINNNLERSGDIAEGIAKYIIVADHPFDAEREVSLKETKSSTRSTSNPTRSSQNLCETILKKSKKACT